MEKTPQIKPVGKLKSGTLKASEQITGFAVPLIYSENSIAMNERIAEGEIEGQKYAVHFGHDGTFFVDFENMEGQTPRMEIKISDLVLLSNEAAKRHQLFKPMIGLKIVKKQSKKIIK